MQVDKLLESVYELHNEHKKQKDAPVAPESENYWDVQT